MRVGAALLLFLSVLAEMGFPCWGATRRAVLIGINQYNPSGGRVSIDPPKKSPFRKALVSGDVRHFTYPDLEGAVNDVNLIAGLLAAPEFGFQPNDIVKLITQEQTTADEILATLRRELVTQAGKDDVRFVYYSGHGNYIRNAALSRANPNTRNEYDQTIVPSDHWQGAIDVRDKELAQILWDSAKKGVTVTFIADSCHSGSLTRGPGNSRGRVRSHNGTRTVVNGVPFPEPVVDDPPPFDKDLGKAVIPEDLGVLTVAAAQENEEAMELRSEKNETHGGMTMALVQALREEGPHASMDRIFERMSNAMRVADLSQTPVLGGKNRGDKDLLGQIAKQEPFTVMAKEVHAGEVLLGGGDAIGLFAGSELRRLSASNGAPSVTLTIVKSLGMAGSAASISPADAKVSAGDRFEVTRWAVSGDPNLRVYVPPAAGGDVVLRAAQVFASLRADPAVHWVDDPTEDPPTDILRWDAGQWFVDRLAGAVTTVDLSGSPSADGVKQALSKGAHLFVRMPPSLAIATAISLGEGTRYPGIQKTTGTEWQNADYRLYGRLGPGGVQYAWVQADADLGSREIPPPAGTPAPAAKSGAHAAASQPASSLLRCSQWLDGNPERVGATLTEYAVRLGKVRAWLTLPGRPGQTEFPYHLVLRKPGSDANVRATTVLHGGEQYKMFLQLDSKYKSHVASRRWVYVFVVNQQGAGTLLFPDPDQGNEGNQLPRSPKAKDRTAAAVPLIHLQDQPADLRIDPPWGTDTYILISTLEPIPNPKIFSFDGVPSATAQSRAVGGSALQNLLHDYGNSTRDAITDKAPSEWSIERMAFSSAGK